MHIIKVDYALVNVCFHLLVVLASIGRFLVVSSDHKRRDSQISRKAAQEYGMATVLEYAALGSKDGAQGVFSSLNCPRAGWVQGQHDQLPLFAVKKH